MQMPGFSNLDEILMRFQSRVGIAVSEDGVVGVSLRRTAGGGFFAHLLSKPHLQRGWAVPASPVRFFAKRTSIPHEFRGREAEFIRYNRPELIPLPDSHSILLRFGRAKDTEETLVHGIRENRLEEFLGERRTQNKLPRLDGIIPPAVALAAAILAVRPGLAGKTLAVLIGTRSTRYIALKNGSLVNVFDDVHRPDRKDASARFRKTMQRVLWYMENEGLGGMPDRIFLLGDKTIESWVVDIQKTAPAAAVSFFDLLAEVKLAVPSDIPAEMPILALGAAFASATPAFSELNFLGIPPGQAARRFDAYDLMIYGSLAVMLALSFITLNSAIASRIQTLNAGLLSNHQHIQTLREEVEMKRGLLPVAEKLVQAAELRTPDPARTGRHIMNSLPEFFGIISETLPDGVQLDRAGSGQADLVIEAPQAYKNILPRHQGQNQITLIGQCPAPDKAMGWVTELAKRLNCKVSMEEMKLDDKTQKYLFRIVIETNGEKSNA